MPVIYSNNASTTLSAGINNSTTTIGIASASGFPTIGSNEYYFATIANTNNTKIEVVKVTAGTTSLTVVRGQDGTSAQAFDSGDNFQLRVTAATLEAASKTDVNITGGAIAGAAITNDVIDSQHYADGSIDHAHLSNDCIDGDNIQDDVINSEHYVAASIDNEHLADNAVNTAEIADDAVTADKLANSVNTDIATGVAALPKSGGAMTGAITTNSTFDGVDVAARDGVLTSTTTTANAALPKAGGTMTGDLILGDNVKLELGNASGGDLQIYHDGTDSHIKDEGTGLLLLSGSTNVKIRAAGTDENMINCVADGGVQLFYDNSNKLETLTGGVQVTGDITVSGTVDGVDIQTLNTTAGAALPKAGGTMTGNADFGDNVQARFGASQDLLIYHDGSNSYVKDNGTGSLKLLGTNNVVLMNSANDENYIHCAEDGSVTLYHDNTAKIATVAAGVTVTGNVTSSNGVYELDGSHYININDANIGFVLDGAEDMRLENDGDLHTEGDVIAYSTTISDATLKYNINPVEFALDKIKELKGVTFNYLKGNKESAGLLAQDVEKVMPSAVQEKKLPLHTDDDKSYKTLHYDSVTAILVEAIKELTAKVEKLENK
jgi:hypothetical protein